jgi:3D (Asp-Asp-Asp) domain-containing protein
MTTEIRPLTGKTLYSANGEALGSGNGGKGSPHYRAHWNGNLFPPPESGCVLYLPGSPYLGTTIQDFSNYFYDCTLDTAEALTDTETELDCSADATTIIPAGSIIQVDEEQMRVTGTGNPTITIVRGFNGTQPVSHDTAKNIFIRTANHGTITGATWLRLPSGLWVNSFDGTDDKITISDNDRFTFSSGGGTDLPFTFLMWIKPTDFVSNRVCLSKSTGFGTGEYHITVLTTTGIALYLYTNSTGKYIGRSTNAGALSSAIYTMLTVTYSASKTSSGVKIYSNSTQVDAADNESLPYGGVENTATDLQIGVRGAASYFKGQIGLTRVFNVALSTTQIAGIYQQERALFGV